ncbi:MAG TPA: nucleotidyltransferase domain-containing protein [Methanocella sp.]|nr:nucleotidyltransferase domain-containing protein [Methanocella sp.]
MLYGVDEREAMAVTYAALKEKKCVPMNVTISGSHLYGFNSPDSDVDFRGSYLCDIRHILGINKPAWAPGVSVVDPKGSMDVTSKSSGVKGGQIDIIKRDGRGEIIYDVVLFEIEKEIRLALKGNCNVIEQMFAPQVYVHPAYEPVKRLVSSCFGKKGICDSYRGMAYENYLKFTKQGKKTTKKYLYIMRGLMAGIHALETGKVEANIEKLNEGYFRIPEVEYLIEKKRQGKENDPVGITNILKVEQRMESMFDEIDAAYAKSDLQEFPTQEQMAEASELVMMLRLKAYEGKVLAPLL